METYLLDWASLLLRWAHAIVGIAWIGASLYFIWLDDSLDAPTRSGAREEGVAGELWAVHGGGFYRAEKFAVAPGAVPQRLHWFKWEAYWTWFTGIALLALIYYGGAGSYLIDPAVRPLSNLEAIGAGLAWLIGGLLVYEGLCRSPLGRNDAALAAVLLVLLAFAAWALTRTFSGRGAFIHYGALIGTIMVGNVAHVIIPGQRRMIEAMRAGRAPDPADGRAGKQRSVHNTYLTLPVVFVMVSNHYAMTFGAAWNWLVLVAFTVAGALIRVWFVRRHKGKASPWPLATGLLVLAGIAALIAPRADPVTAPAAFADVGRVIAQRCAGCHAEKPSFPGAAPAPKGMLLDTPERIRAQALQIHQQAVATRVMPPGNVTNLTDEERALLDRWYRAGARAD
ncbi:MAG: hypothetical protein EXR31_10330 [Betaproteobacteria bacterium]|nr:hypothetical protein [Betaproteobacteria bacterium]